MFEVGFETALAAKKCNIKEISKYLIKEGKLKGFPDISRKE